MDPLQTDLYSITLTETKTNTN